uniref:Translocon-associated protein subunit delta n=1 Tax=Pratylenchus goodeyi TaxID=344392 RepID=V5THB7_9BILA|nr:translocon associated protein delta subunit [Pratylenchus goodeyi]
MRCHILLAFILFNCLSFATVSGASCESPKYSSSGYSTQDGFFHYRTTFIVELALQCSNNYQQDGQFYAVVNGQSQLMAVSEETLKYQISWQWEHTESSSQTIDLHIYDEAKFNEYKKSVQNGVSNPVSAASPLFSTQYYHPGVSKKTPVSSEIVFLLVGAAALYYGYHLKQQLAKRD